MASSTGVGSHRNDTQNGSMGRGDASEKPGPRLLGTVQNSSSNVVGRCLDPRSGRSRSSMGAAAMHSMRALQSVPTPKAKVTSWRSRLSGPRSSGLGRSFGLAWPAFSLLTSRCHWLTV